MKKISNTLSTILIILLIFFVIASVSKMFNLDSIFTDLKAGFNDYINVEDNVTDNQNNNQNQSNPGNIEKIIIPPSIIF